MKASSGTNALSYTLSSRGIGGALAIPVPALAFNGGSVTNNNLPAREAAYYAVTVPSNTPNWKFRLRVTSGEALLIAFGVAVLWHDPQSAELGLFYAIGLTTTAPLLLGGAIARRRVIA